MDYSLSGFSVRRIFQKTGVGCRFLLQGILLIPRSNLHLLRLLHCRQILYWSATGDAQRSKVTYPKSHVWSVADLNSVLLLLKFTIFLLSLFQLTAPGMPLALYSLGTSLLVMQV